MDHESHVGLVDTHAEGDGGDNDVDFLMQEGVLVFRAGGAVHTGVVRQGVNIVYFEKFGQLLHFFAAQAVDDA